MKKHFVKLMKAGQVARRSSMSQPMSRAEFLRGIGVAAITGAAATTGTLGLARSAMAKEGGKTVLHASQKDGSVTYIEPAGKVYLPTERVGWWDDFPHENHRVSQDYQNIANAVWSGGTVVLKPGTYYLHHLIDFPDFGLTDYPLVADMNSAYDFVLKGEDVDENGPGSIIDLYHFWALGGHAAYDEFTWDDPAIPTTTQQIENLQITGGVKTTSIGQYGKVDLTIKNCNFLNCGGITCHPLGRIAFIDNIMENTVYGISVLNWNAVGFPGGGMAYCDVLVKGNTIRCEGNAISLDGLGYNLWCSSEPILTGEARSIEVWGNECESSYSYYCIGISKCHAMAVIHHNTCIHKGPNFTGISINGTNEEDGAVIKNNTITSTFNEPPFGAPWSAISLTAANGVTVQSNRVKGEFYWPIFVSEGFFADFYSQFLGQPSEANALIGNNLNSAKVLPDLPNINSGSQGIPGWFEDGFKTSHYLFALGSADNWVRGGAAAGNNVIVYDVNGDSTTNLVAGLDHRIGHMVRNDPNYLTMQQAMAGKFEGIRHRVDWWNGEELSAQTQ